MANPDKRIGSIAKELSYVIGRKPDEFGLVPDRDGYFSIKEVMQVFSQQGKILTKNDINELLLKDKSFELEGNRIRPKEIFFTIEDIPPEFLPDIVYTFVRKRAHSTVYKEGIMYPDRFVLLFRDREFASEIGKRKTKDPIVLEISTKILSRHSIRICALGNLLLAESVPKDAIVGPRPEANEREVRKVRKAPEVTELPGSFILKPEGGQSRHGKGKKAKGWKELMRKSRKKWSEF